MKNYKQILGNQNRETRPWVIWIWNQAITRDEMIAQFNTLISQGFGGIIIRPGRDMVPAFLSEEFFDLFKCVLDGAREQGIGIRIGDDLSLPWSGSFTALCNQNPALRGQSLVLTETCIKQERETFSCAVGDPKRTIVMIARVKNGTISASELKMPPLTSNKPFQWKAPAGEWRVMVFKKEFVNDPAGGYVPNVYNTRAAQMYLQNVLAVFKKRYSRYTGSTFKGFLTEMPAYRTGDGAIPWDDDLVVKFRTKYKKDLLKYIPALFFDAPQAARIRNQVYAYLDQSMYERFALPIEVWAKNAKLTQWVLCPEQSIHRTGNALIDGDFHTDNGLSMVGLQNIDGTEENFPLLRAMADINQNDYRRGTLAVVGRNRNGIGATPQSLKSEIDTHLLSGATQIIVDGCYFTVDQRSYLKTPHNPSWYPSLGDFFKPLCEYAARMQGVLHGAGMQRSVALLCPSGAVRALYKPTEGEPVNAGALLLQKTVNALVHQNLDFVTVGEEDLLRCTVKSSGEFGKTDSRAKGQYRMLLVPYAPLVSRSLLVFLEKVVSKKGTVLFVDDSPKGTYEDGVSSSVTKRIERLLNPKKSPSRIVAADALEAVLAALPGRMITMEGQDDVTPDILSIAAVDQAATVYGFHNRSDHQEYSVKVRLPQEKRFTFLDCHYGTMTEVNDVQREGDRSVMTIHLQPYRTVLIVASPGMLAGALSKPVKGTISPFTPHLRNYRIVLKNQWVFDAVTMNALPLSAWNQRIGLSRDSGGFSHFYESHFQIGTLPEECYLVMSRMGGDHARLQGAFSQTDINVNGTRIDRPVMPSTALPEPATGATRSEEAVLFHVSPQEMKTRCLFGGKEVFYNVTSLLAKGFNRVALRTSGLVIDPPTVLYPPLLLGSFSIMRGPNGWIIEKSGANVGNDSWTKHGYPYLSGVGQYRQSFEVPQQYSRLILRISQVTGVVEIRINNKPVGNRFAWQPIEADITSLCEHKRNELSITVANTIDNILRMNARASGILGGVFLDVS
ncbi:MAG: hypothetical protein JXA71_11240 [Chitinispirillaceae bacterium]|nr:hypothetical protein [Chitinispirillaceae bacterium]